MESFKRHADDEYFDEVSIVMVPRWKTSGLSGDEWRVSARLQLKRKGFLIFEKYFHRLETAIAALPWFALTALETSESVCIPSEIDNKLCDQVGCASEATHYFKFKKEYSRDGGFSSDPHFILKAKFCDAHKRRGDCGLMDSDINYEQISAPVDDKPAQKRQRASDRLVAAMVLAGCPDTLQKAAASGYYDDFRSPLPAPCMQLVQDLRDYPDLAERVKCGEFDAEPGEAEEWEKSPEGVVATEDFKDSVILKAVINSVLGKTQ